MSISALQPAEETAAANRPRVPLLDPLLMLAGIGLVVSSVPRRPSTRSSSP
jgi:hypothetical protein